jgi:hypothetical protein
VAYALIGRIHINDMRGLTVAGRADKGRSLSATILAETGNKYGVIQMVSLSDSTGTMRGRKYKEDGRVDGVEYHQHPKQLTTTRAIQSQQLRTLEHLYYDINKHQYQAQLLLQNFEHLD